MLGHWGGLEEIIGRGRSMPLPPLEPGPWALRERLARLDDRPVIMSLRDIALIRLMHNTGEVQLSVTEALEVSDAIQQSQWLLNRLDFRSSDTPWNTPMWYLNRLGNRYRLTQGASVFQRALDAAAVRREGPPRVAKRPRE